MAGLRGAKAIVSFRGHTLHFGLKLVKKYPDSLVRDLIAHELAHVLQAAWGWYLGIDDSFEAEEDADLRMEHWGFDAVAMDAWDREHGISKFIKIDPDTPSGEEGPGEILGPAPPVWQVRQEDGVGTGGEPT